MEGPFIYIDIWRVVICKICKYGCVANEIERHLERPDHHVPDKKARQQIAYTIQAIPNIIASQEELGNWQPPSPYNAESPYLLPAKPDGLGCPDCLYVSRQTNKIQEHGVQIHKWESQPKTGRPSKAEGPGAVPWRTGVRCQRIFKNRKASGWFEVDRSLHNEAAGRDQTDNPAGETIQEKVLRISGQQYQKIQQQSTIIQAEGDKTEAEKWLRRTGWTGHLAGLDYTEMRKTIRPIEEDEPDLRNFWQGCERAINTAKRIANANKVGLGVLFEVNRKVAETRDEKPFDNIMEKDTWVTYKEVMRQVACYFFRTRDMPEDKRPPYRLTSQQEQYAEKVVEAAENIDIDDVDDVDGVDGIADGHKVSNINDTADPTAKAKTKLDRLCLDMLISWFDHDIKESHYDNIVISALAVIGIREDGGWVAAIDFTPKFSAIIKIARMLVISQSYHEREEEVAKWQQLLPDISERDARERAQGLYRTTRNKVRRFMIKASGKTHWNPMDWIYTTSTYGQKIRFTTTAAGTIDWHQGHISYQGIRFSMNQLQDAVHNLIQEAQQTLEELLMMDDDEPASFPPIHWDRIHDDQSNSSVGYSFSSDPRNQWSVDGQTWLMERMVHDEGRRRHWIQEDAAQPFRAEAARTYKRQLDRFREYLLTLAHICGGMVVRGPTMLGLRYRNTSHGGIRNITIDQGMVGIVTSYDKNYRQTDQVKIIHRFLPREIGELFVWYLWLVLPFWQQVTGVMTGADQASAFVWSRCMVSREQDNVSSEEAERADQEARALDGNSAMPALEPEQRALVGAQWSSDRMRRILQRHTERFLGQKIGISAWRQISIAIARYYFSGEYRTVGDHTEEEDDYDEDDEENNIWDLQAGHGTHIAGMLYARLITESPFSTSNRRNQFRKISVRWHRFLGLGECDGGLRTQKRQREAFAEERDEVRIRRWKRLARVDICGQLRQMMGGEEARFRGNQERTIRAIMRGEDPVMQIVGTGSGKSLSFMLPAYCGGEGVTIVIVPLVALQEDMARRCEALQIDAEVWSSRRSHRAASIILVTPESAHSKEFQNFVQRLSARGQLDRVVLDEAHMPLEAGKANAQTGKRFRPKLREIGPVMAGFGAQTVLLTATLPPRDEEEYFQLMGMDRRRVQIYRASTTRKNIQYRVRYIHPEGSIEGAACDAAEQYVQGSDSGKVIIYGQTIECCTALGEQLQCPVYYADVDGDEGKRRIMKEWIERGRIIVATNALGLGIDIPDVRLVIHAGRPRQLRSYAQESGRGGRDGLRSEAVIIARVHSTATTERGRQGDSQGNMDIGEFIDGGDCRRVVLDEVMDGRTDRMGCEEGEEMCDRCEEAAKAEAEREAQWEADSEGGRETGERQHGSRIDSGFCEGMSSAGSQVTSKDPFDWLSSSPLSIPAAKAGLGVWPSSPALSSRVMGGGTWSSRSQGQQGEVWRHSDAMRSSSLRRNAADGETGSRQAQEDGSQPVRDHGSSDDSPSTQRVRAIFQRVGRERVWDDLQRRKRAQQEAEEVSDFMRRLEEWRGVCVKCRVGGRPDLIHTRPEECEEEYGEEWAYYAGIQAQFREELFSGRKKRFEPYSGCFQCGLPYELCEGWEAADDDGGRFRRAGCEGGCKDEGLMVEVIAGVWKEFGRVMERVLERMMEEDAEEIGMFVWMGRRVKWGGLETNNLCRFFGQACQVWEMGIRQRDKRGQGEKRKKEDIDR